MIFIYAFEEHSAYLPLVKPFFRKWKGGKIMTVTSTITLRNAWSTPFRAKAMGLAARYKTLFRDFPHLSVIPVTEEIAERAAWLRASRSTRSKPPIAIQLATA